MRRAPAFAAFLLLAACTSLPRASPVPPSGQIAHLNHFYTTVDAETAAAIEKSAFLRRFANVEVRTTTGTRSSWTGIYLYGRQTYAEFFGPDGFQIADQPAPVGGWGIALSGDRPGHVEQLKSRLESVGHKAIVEVDTRTFGTRKVPWFTALTAVSKHGDSGGRNDVIAAWAMEYVQSYFDLAEAAKEVAEGPNDSISRERYQSDAYRQRMMRDITRVEFSVAAKDFARLEPLLVAAGFRLEATADGIIADGDETDFLFHTASGRMGLRKIAFALNSPVAANSEIIGRSRLSVGPGATAEWQFD